MTWLYVLLGIVLFIVLLLLIPVGFKADYEGDVRAAVTVGFISIPVYPPKPKKKKKKKKPEKPKEEEKKAEKSLEMRNFATYLIM